jgi:fibro-slime domain-containing protein
MVKHKALLSGIASVAAGVLLVASHSYGQAVYPPTIQVPVTFFDYHSDGSCPDFNPGTDPGGARGNNTIPYLGLVQDTLDANGLPIRGDSLLFSYYVGKWFRPWPQSQYGQGSDYMRPTYGVGGNPPSYGMAVTLPIGQVGYDTSYKNVVIPDTLIFDYIPGSHGQYQINVANFFPLDGMGFGADPNTKNWDYYYFTAAAGGPPGTVRGGDYVNRATNQHNYSFAMHLKRTFTYEPGLNFNFKGDDDLWVFINGKLVLDLGGMHNNMPGGFALDTMAARLGLTVGKTATIDVFYCERQATGSNIIITSNIITANPVKLELDMNPKVDTLAAGSFISFAGKVIDDTGGIRHEFDQQILWSLSPANTSSRISATSGGVDTFYAVQAYTTYIISAQFTDQTNGKLLQAADTVYVKPGPPDHLVIEADPNGLTRSPNKDNPVGGNGSVTIGSTDLSDSVYATLRDKYGNYVGQSQNTKWDTITIITPNVVKVASGIAAIGQGVISKLGVPDSELVRATALPQPLLTGITKTMMDTVKVYVSNITYDALRIVSLSPGDTIVLSQLVMTTDQDTLLTVQGLRTAINDWVNVPGNWSLSANLKSDTAAPSSKVNWVFSPTDTGKGTITVTFAGKTVSIPVTVNPGAPRSLVLYPQPGVPSAANKALPRDSTVVAGVNFPLVAKMFDNNDVWLSSYESAASNTLISWQLSDTSIGTLTPLSGYKATFNSTKAHHSVVIIATFKQGTAIYTDTIGLTILPGPATQLVIEANKDINLSPNAADPVDSITINAGETDRSVYAMLRDAYGNWVAYSQVTLWTSFNNLVATATGGVAIQGEGIVTRTTDSGTTFVSAVDAEPAYASLHLADTIKVIMANIFYRALRIVVRDSTQIDTLSMNTNQDTTLKVQGLRSDNGKWEYVSAQWSMQNGLSTDPMPPGQAANWTFSPVTPGTGWIHVSMANDSTKPDSVFAIFTPGPPTKVTIAIITPANQLIAGDTILALVQINNKDGLVPGAWCYDGSNGAIYQDGLGSGGRKTPVVIGDSGAGPLNQAPSSANKTDECFQNGTDTIKFILYYAPYGGDTAHQIFVSLGSLNATTAPFTLLPGPLNSLALEDANSVHQPDTLHLNYPAGHAVVYAVGYDQFGNKIGPENSNWTYSNTLHSEPNSASVSRIYYETGSVTSDEQGSLLATAAGGVKDSMYIFVKGPLSSLDSAVTRDVNGDGYLDEIELYFNKTVTILPSTNFTITSNGVVFQVDSVSGVGTTGATGTHFIAYLHEQQNGQPQTAWKPLVSITGMQGVADIKNFSASDGAGPVIWSVTKTITNPEDRSQDVITVTFSEPITGPGGTQFAWSTVKPSDVLAVYHLNAAGTGYDTLYNALDGIAQFSQVIGDSIVKFTVTNGNDITQNDFMNIKVTAGQIFDARGNAPVTDNRKAPVKIIGALPPRIIAVPNPSGPTFLHEQPGTLNFVNNPNARNWVRVERAGTVITFKIAIPSTPGEIVTGYLKIYDAVGNTVITADSKDVMASLKSSGANDSSAYDYDIYWNGSNEMGFKVAPGVYRTVVYLTYTSPAKSEKKRLWGTVGITY